MAFTITGGRKIVSKESFVSEEKQLLTEEQIETLKKQGINDWNQIHSLLQTDSNRVGLLTLLNINDENGKELESLSNKFVTHKIESLPEDLQKHKLPFGAFKTETKFTKKDLQKQNSLSSIRGLSKLNNLEMFLANDNIQMASAVNYVTQLPPVVSQGDRGTCTAFAVTILNEFSFYRKTGRYTDLSEQYLFCEMKKLEGDSGCGGYIHSAISIIGDKGECPENVWSYNPSLPCDQRAGEPSNADDYASPYKNGYVPFNDTDDIMLQVRGALSVGHLVAFSIPIFASWYNNSETIRTGIIVMPYSGEPPLKDPNGNDAGHTMAIVGYQDDQNAPGGGFFIVRNSWGPQNWGTQNHYAPGYGMIPYAFVKRFLWEIYAM